ncbi:hypothetical protein OE88DRAFT_1776920 [Heliocybe sulcata]|uniref:Uncharacterized protein n=1 Tax=Heliocybe sulcata TaxID=5364 RepID=A0A5C3MLG6_9AGAM|nr:hypothetical protein OE88DRAFT_1776920 [Heliocybe sulcata]
MVVQLGPATALSFGTVGPVKKGLEEKSEVVKETARSRRAYLVSIMSRTGLNNGLVSKISWLETKEGAGGGESITGVEATFEIDVEVPGGHGNSRHQSIKVEIGERSPRASRARSSDRDPARVNPKSAVRNRRSSRECSTQVEADADTMLAVRAGRDDEQRGGGRPAAASAGLWGSKGQLIKID